MDDFSKRFREMTVAKKKGNGDLSVDFGKIKLGKKGKSSENLDLGDELAKITISPKGYKPVRGQAKKETVKRFDPIGKKEEKGKGMKRKSRGIKMKKTVEEKGLSEDQLEDIFDQAKQEKEKIETKKYIREIEEMGEEEELADSFKDTMDLDGGAKKKKRRRKSGSSKKKKTPGKRKSLSSKKKKKRSTKSKKKRSVKK